MTTMIGGAPISSILATNVSWYGLTNSSAQYYTGEAQSQLIRKCYETFLTIGNTAYLAIIMCFCLGLRIGELVALKVSDFDFEAGVVHIYRREVTSKDESGKRSFRISTRLKNGASRRDIPITATCNFIFEQIVADNEKRGVTSDWLFISTQNGDRMHSCSIDMALDRANNNAGLEQRSLHKIRKTFLSRLDMSRLFTMERIREIAGHSRGSMTLSSIIGLTWVKDTSPASTSFHTFYNRSERDAIRKASA